MLYNLAALQRAVQAGGRFRYLFFWGHTPSPDGSIGPSCLSQWWMSPFTVDGVSYSCAEQYMMAEKARLFGDEAMLRQILAAAHPKEMKAYGRAVQGFEQPRWDACCYDLVLRGNLAKFGQNPALLAFLLGTAGRILVEASPRDRIWGIGMGRQNPDAANPMKWRGRNLLGFALTQARDILAAEQAGGSGGLSPETAAEGGEPYAAQS